MKAFASRGFSLHESAADFILVGISSTDRDSHEITERLAGNEILVRGCAMFQGLDGRAYVRVAVWRRKENQRLIRAVDAVV